MTENKIGSLVGDLVAMAKAFEELPKVQEALEIEKETSEICARQVQAREESILGYKRDIEILTAKVRELEVARDDAELRFLELEEKAHKALGDFEAIAALVNAGKNELSPPKPEPQQEPKAVDGPISHGEQQGQSEANPTASSPDGSGNQLVTASSSNVAGQEAVSAATEPPPYANKFYIDVQGYVSRSDWLAGGGTDESYDYRRGYVETPSSGDGSPH